MLISQKIRIRISETGFSWFLLPARKSKVDHIKPGKDTSYQKAKEIGPDTR